jgi:hypothetical protein
MGVTSAEDHADQSRTPTRVVLTQPEGVLTQLGRDRRGGDARRGIIGSHRGVPPQLKAPDEVAHGAGYEAQSSGDGWNGLALSAALPDRSPDGQRQGTGHEYTSRVRSPPPSNGVSLPAKRRSGKTGVAIVRHKLLSGLGGKT